MFFRKPARAIAAVPFDWIDAHLPRFGVRDSVFNTPGESMPWRVKPLVELMWLLSVLRRHDIDIPQGRRIFAWCAVEARAFDWHAMAAFDPSAAAPMAIMADLFGLYDEVPPFEPDFYAQIARSGYFAGMDRVAYREMDIVYCLWRLGAADLYGQIGRLFGNTAFGREQPLHRYTIDDIYSLTHAIFYLTDVGCGSVTDQLGATAIARLRFTLIALMVIIARGDNCDVLGELLVCWMFCGFDTTAAETRYLMLAERRFLANQTQSGAVASTRAALERAQTGTAAFEELYHTTLVAALWRAFRPAEWQA